jgi:hypothetical protein
MRIGDYYSPHPSPWWCSYKAWLAFDTDITVEIEELTSVTFKLYVSYEAMESGEGASVYVYNIGGNFDSNSCKESNTNWALGTHSSESGVFDLSSTGWRTGDSTKMGNLLNDWASSRGDSEDMISIHLVKYQTDSATRDYACIDESTSSHDPELTFSYVTDYCWALIVAGSDGKWSSPPPEGEFTKEYTFTYNALKMYQTLTDTYEGYTEERIYLLTPWDWVWGEAVPRNRTTSVANFNWAVNQIASNADSTDQVLIFWSGHGTNDTLWKINNWNFYDDHDISASDFDSKLDTINCSEMIIIIESCFSGSLIDDLNDEQNRLIYTSSNYTTSYGWNEFDGDEWMGGWFSNSSICALDPDFNASDADTNSDDRVSLYEMYLYANQTTIDIWTQRSEAWKAENPMAKPQRWVGTGISDSETYIYDGYY